MIKLSVFVIHVYMNWNIIKRASGSGYYKCSMFLIENALCYIYILYVLHSHCSFVKLLR